MTCTNPVESQILPKSHHSGHIRVSKQKELKKFAKLNRPFNRYGGHFVLLLEISIMGCSEGKLAFCSHPIISIWNNIIQNGRRIGKKVYRLMYSWTTDPEAKVNWTVYYWGGEIKCFLSFHFNFDQFTIRKLSFIHSFIFKASLFKTS